MDFGILLSGISNYLFHVFMISLSRHEAVYSENLQFLNAIWYICIASTNKIWMKRKFWTYWIV